MSILLYIIGGLSTLYGIISFFVDTNDIKFKLKLYITIFGVLVLVITYMFHQQLSNTVSTSVATIAQKDLNKTKQNNANSSSQSPAMTLPIRTTEAPSAELEKEHKIYLGGSIHAYTNGSYYKEFSSMGGSTFSMGGVSYTNGFTIGTYADGGYVYYNLNGQYKLLTGVAGNIDGVNYELKYNVLGDGQLLSTIAIKGGGLPVSFRIDVTGVKELKIQAAGSSNYGDGVGFGNVVLSTSESEAPVAEEPNTPDKALLGTDIHAYTNGSYYKEFSSMGGSTFSMGGVSYTNGFTIGTYADGGYVYYNLNGQYKLLTGVAGNIDGVNYELKYNVLGDGQLLSTIAIKGGGLPVSFRIDVTGVKELKIQAAGSSNYGDGVGFGNVVLSTSESEAPVAEEPNTPDKALLGTDIHAYTNGSYYEEFSSMGGSTFSMGGVSYTNGFTIGTYADGGYVYYNLNGQYKLLTGVAGNIDGVNYELKYNVLGDGQLLSTIAIKGGGLPVSFRIDVTGVKELKIQAAGSSNYGDGVGFGNVVLSTSESEAPVAEEPNTPDKALLGTDIHAYTNGSYYKEFSHMGGSTFSMGGVSYTNGFTIGTYADGGYVYYNLNGQYKLLTGVAGNIDGVNYELKYNVLGDGQLLSTIAIKGGGLPVSFRIDVTGVKELKIQAAGSSNYGDGVGFGNVVLSTSD